MDCFCGTLKLSNAAININQVILYRPSTKKVHWMWGPGNVVMQHYARLTPRNTLIIFDNMHKTGTSKFKEGSSRVVELDPVTKKIIWTFGDNEGDEHFYSYHRGSAQELPNGNILINTYGHNESRAFEIAKSNKEIVWNSWYGILTAALRKKAMYRAQVYRMERYPSEILDEIQKMGETKNLSR